MEKNIITKLDLMGSSNCNLKCSYCYITKNCTFHNYDKIVRQAWDTGSYLSTIKKVFNILKSDPKDIKDLEFWGGEPTLHLDVLSKQGKLIGELFPNIEFLLIPTNWYQINMKHLVDFIYNLDKGIAPRKEDSQLNFHLQASIDGPPGDFNTYGHHVDWNQYKKQFDDFCFYLKQKEQKLNNIKIILTISATSQQQYILKNLKTYEQILDFSTYIKKACEYINTQLKQLSNLTIFLNTNIWTPTIAIPATTSLEESFELEKIVKIINYHDYVNNISYSSLDANSIQLFHGAQGEQLYLNRNHECPESNEHAITLMPDGTIAECPCTFLHNLEEYKKELLNEKNYWEYKSCLIRDGSFYNPLEKNLEKDKFHAWYVYGGGFLGTQSTYANLNLCMAYEMALSRQIDYNYALNPQLLIDHYIANFTTSECYRENVNVTHNHFLTDHNMFRRWYNGFTEYAYNDHKNKIYKIFENILKGEDNFDSSRTR